MSEPSDAEVRQLAETLYEKCLQAPTGYLFTVKELQDLMGARRTNEAVQRILNELLRTRKLQAMTKTGGIPVFKAIPVETLEKIQNMTPDEEMLYMYIQEAAREGIWSKTLKQKSNMHTTTMSRALKTLETKRFVKVIQSVKNPTRKIYMLYELTPSIDVSGGPWFTEGEMDDEFITMLLTAIHKFISSRSLPKGNREASFPPDYTGYPTLNQIYLWVKNSDLVNDVELAEADIKSLVDVLVYDGKVERVTGNTAYKAVRRMDSTNGFTEAPCGRCPVFALCREGGPVSASNCKYFEEWLNPADEF